MSGTVATIAANIVGAVFEWVFKANKDVVRSARTDIYSAVKGLSKLSGKQLREFLAAIPIFVSFVIVLVENRKKLDAQKELIIIGAGAALGTICTWLVVSVLTATTVQLSLAVAWPMLGVPLLVSTSAFIFAIVVFLVWAIVFALNTALSSNENFRHIRDQFLKPKSIEMLGLVSDTIAGVEANDTAEQKHEKRSKLSSIGEVVNEALSAQGEKANTEAVVENLKRRIDNNSFSGLNDRLDRLNRAAEAREKRDHEEAAKREIEAQKREERSRAVARAGDIIVPTVKTAVLILCFITVAAIAYSYIYPDRAGYFWSLVAERFDING